MKIKHQWVIVAKARENSYTEKCCYLNSPCVLLDRLVHYHIPTCPETLGICFNIYNPLFILTGYKQGVSRLHAGRADSTQAAREVRQTHGLTDFKRSISPNKSSGIIGALRCWCSALCVLDTWLFLAYCVAGVRHLQLTAGTLAALNQHFLQNGSCHSAPGLLCFPAGYIVIFLILLCVAVYAWMISSCWISLTEPCDMRKILVPGTMVSEKSYVLKLSFSVWSWEYKTDDPHTE